MSLNLATLLTESTKRKPTHTALIMDSFKMNYAELNGASNKVANFLTSLGLQRGQKVAIMLPNTPQFVMAYFGALKTGAAVVPLNVLLKEAEVAYHLDDSDAVALIAWEGFADAALAGFRESPRCENLIIVNAPGSTALPEGEHIHSFNQLFGGASPVFEMVQTNPDDTAIILYTSGTTGRPKGAELTHFSVFFNARMQLDQMGIKWNEYDVTTAALPLFHIFGLSCVLNTTIGAGLTVTMMPRFDPVKAFEVIQRDKVTKFSGVPTMYFMLLNHPDRKKYDLSSLEFANSGGAAIPVEVLNTWEREFGFKILEGFGLSETSPVICFNQTFFEPKAGSIGKPVWGIDMRIVNENNEEVPTGEVGELIVRGHAVMKGYYKKPDATAQAIRDGWFHTGDVAMKDEEGYYFIVDRIKDMIIRGGFNVYPREVEEVLYAHPAVAEGTVIGVKDQAFGEEVKAIVVLKPDTTATEDEIREFCKARLAAYKYPRIVEIRTEPLPKNASGKILKRELR